jgi:apolipoprotein N-acyltransferase
LQISQTRALESGRMMLRATNTGATAIIDPHGEIVAEAPHFTTTALTGQAQGYSGETPYVRWGNWPAISLIFLALGVLWGRKKK